jgi:hypothetical protein
VHAGEQGQTETKQILRMAQQKSFVAAQPRLSSFFHYMRKESPADSADSRLSAGAYR